MVVPHFLNMFWQIPDGAEILLGHLPTTIPYAISAGPIVAQEWLFEAALAWSAQHNAYGLIVIGCGLAAAATPLLVYAAVRAFGISDVAAGVVAFLVLGSRFAGSAIRPETFAVDAFAVELYLLARRRHPAALVACVALWANLHASVILAPLAAAAFALTAYLGRGTLAAAVRHASLMLAAALLGTLLTPHGLHLWGYAITLAVAPNPTREHLDTWRALNLASGAAWAVLPGLLVLLWFGVQRRREYASEIVIGAICLIATFTHERYAMFLAVGWAPALARSLDASGCAALASRRPRAALLALAPLFVFALLGGVPRLNTPVEPVGPWQAAADIVARHQLHGNTYAPYVWAAFLHWRGLPLRLLIDAHGDPYARDVWNDHLALENARPNWRDVLNRRRISNVILPHDSPLVQALLLDPDWRRVDARDGIVAFNRRSTVSIR